jgi:hypothetical protein
VRHHPEMVPPDVDVRRILAGLGSHRSAEFDSAVEQAKRVGSVGDQVLAEALANASGYRATSIAAALGDVDGDHGDAALRSVLTTTGPGTQDVRCAALVALTKRNGAAATDDMLAALHTRDSGVREYALLCLVHAGDEKGCDEVLAWVVALLKRTPRKAGFPETVGSAIAYLTRHCEPGSDQIVVLVTALRTRWLPSPHEKQAWLLNSWPEAAPGGPAPAECPLPRHSPMTAWGFDRLFDPINPHIEPNVAEQ